MIHSIPGRGIPGRTIPGRAYVAEGNQPPTINMGRYRQGDLLVLTYEPGGIPSSPPMAYLFGSGGLVATEELWTRDRATYVLDELLGRLYPIGYYLVTITSSLGTARYIFQVVPGGDPEGNVVAMHHQKSVNGWTVVAQLASGRLVKGKNPKV